LVLADEPTGNLDSGAAKTLLGHFAALNRRQLVTILMVTHDPLAASYADRVVFIQDGRIFAELGRDGQPSRTLFGRILDTLSHLEGAWDDD
jgi:ABC-type lipoprotein export system ATPase subunit